MIAEGSELVLMLKLLVPAGVTETPAEPLAVESAVLVAVTVTAVATATVGAVKRPELEIVPAEADQVTPVMLVSRTEAANCCVPPDVIDALDGETVTMILLPDPLETVTVNL